MFEQGGGHERETCGANELLVAQARGEEFTRYEATWTTDMHKRRRLVLEGSFACLPQCIGKAFRRRWRTHILFYVKAI